jgi:hypothetical protein
MSFINIPASESGLPSALEQFYKELLSLVGERVDQPIILNNTITTFDIVPEAPFYSEGVFRQFADRKFKSSPSELGDAIQADRFSYEYERVIEIAATKIDTTLSEDGRQKIENYRREILRVSRELTLFEATVNENWLTIARNEGLTEGTYQYDLRRLNYLEQILYADQKELFTGEIQGYNRKINIIRYSAYTPAQQKLIRSQEELADAYKISRPWRTSIELANPGITEMSFADPRFRSRQLFDVSPAIYPSEDLVRFVQRPNGTRSIDVTQNTQHNELHERTWGAGGSASYGAFFIRVGGGGGGSGESSFRSEFNKLLSFKMDFAGIGEIYANRGLWFDPSLFADPELKGIFDQIPGARNLEYVGVSLIVARGLSLELNFDTTLEVEQWTRRRFNASGGVRVFGFSFGGGGGSTSYDYGFDLSTDKKSVKFSDDPKHCRLLGVRVERIYHPQRVDNPSGDFARLAFTKGLKDGRISLAKFHEMKLNGCCEDDLKTLIGENHNEVIA